MSLIAPQPAPAASDARPVWPLVIADVERTGGLPDSGSTRAMLIADMHARDEQGRAKYSVPLTAHNGRDHLVDAYQEALDLTVYLRAEIEEGDPRGAATGMYPIALAWAHRLREALEAPPPSKGG